MSNHPFRGVQKSFPRTRTTTNKPLLRPRQQSLVVKNKYRPSLFPKNARENIKQYSQPENSSALLPHGVEKSMKNNKKMPGFGTHIF